MPLNAVLNLETKLRAGKTVLQDSYCTQPFKIANITEDKLSSHLKLMLMSSSPGILEGDTYNMQVTVGEGCSLELITQSYQRLFQMKQGASQSLQVKMQRGSSFVYLPHPVVPHRNAVFTSKSKIFLAEDCALLWGEVINCGRKLNGEVFQFSSYHNLTEIYLNNRLAVKENILLQPQQSSLSTIGQLEGFSHQATLLYLKEEVAVAPLLETLVEKLELQDNIIFGVSALPVNGLVIRLLGHKAEQLFQLVQSLGHVLQRVSMFIAKTSEEYVD